MPRSPADPLPDLSRLDEMHEHAGDAAQLMKALGNEQRLLILCNLLERPLSVGELNERRATQPVGPVAAPRGAARTAAGRTRREAQSDPLLAAAGPGHAGDGVAAGDLLRRACPHARVRRSARGATAPATPLRDADCARWCTRDRPQPGPARIGRFDPDRPGPALPAGPARAGRHRRFVAGGRIDRRGGGGSLRTRATGRLARRALVRRCQAWRVHGPAPRWPAGFPATCSSRGSRSPCSSRRGACWRPAAPDSAGRLSRARARSSIAGGAGVGLLSGIVGVGGGFLIVPALVLLASVPMSRAVGTSLAIITLNSLAGFATYVSVLAAKDVQLDWRTLAIVAGVGIAGSLLGHRLGAPAAAAAAQDLRCVLLLIAGAIVVDVAQSIGRLARRWLADDGAPRLSSRGLAALEIGQPLLRAASFSRVRFSTALCTSNSSRVTRSSRASCACSTPLKFCSRSRPTAATFSGTALASRRARSSIRRGSKSAMGCTSDGQGRAVV